MVFRNMVTINQMVSACLHTGLSDYVQHQQGDGKNKGRTEIQDFNRCVSLTVTELITIIIEEFLPR